MPNDLHSFPKDYTAYLLPKQSKLDIIKQNVKINATSYSEKMLARENCNIKQLVLSPGDYVYLTDESSGSAKKLKSHYQGPFVVRSVLSDQAPPGWLIGESVGLMTWCL